VKTNYLGSVWALRAFLPGLVPGSHVVNVVSVAATVADGPTRRRSTPSLRSRARPPSNWDGRASRSTPSTRFVETPASRSASGSAGSEPPRCRPPFVVERILDAVDHDRREIFVPRWYRPFAWLQALLPGTIANARARRKA